MYAVYGTLAKFRDTEGPNMVELVLRAGAKITSLKLFKFICCDIVNPEHLVQLAIMNGTEFLALKDTWGETVLHKASERPINSIHQGCLSSTQSR